METVFSRKLEKVQLTKVQSAVLKPKEFLFMIFVASKYRQLPQTLQNNKSRTENYDKTEEIPLKIAQKCLDIVHELDHVEIGVLAWSVYKV